MSGLLLCVVCDCIVMLLLNHVRIMTAIYDAMVMQERAQYLLKDKDKVYCQV